MLSYVLCGLDHATLARFHIPDSSNHVNHFLNNSEIAFIIDEEEKKEKMIIRRRRKEETDEEEEG